MDPTLYPWLGGAVPFLGGTPGAGDVPQQPAQAPVGPPANQGFFGGLRNLVQGGGGATQGPAPDFGSAGGAGLFPFASQNQNVPYFPPPPSTSGGGGVPLPQPRPENAPQGENTTRTGLEQGGGGNKLMDALRGVKAPAPPQVQTVRTPPPPQLAPIKGGEFVSMLSSLGISPQEFIRMKMGGLR